MYTEASSPRQSNDTASLLSPVLSTSSSNTVRGCVQFWFHMYGSAMGTLEVKVDGQLLWQRSGNQGNRWLPAAAAFQANTSYQV